MKRPEDHLEDLMLNWVRWMRSGGLSQFRVTCRSVGQGFKHYDRESSYIELDLRLAKAVDAIVSVDLKAMERDAINSEYLDATWLHETEIGYVLVVAREDIRRGLKRRGVVVDDA